MNQTQIDALDLTISALRAHEKRMDELVNTFVELIAEMTRLVKQSN